MIKDAARAALGDRAAAAPPEGKTPEEPPPQGTPVTDASASEPQEGAAPPLPPPDMERPWAAEIVWSTAGDEARFEVVAKDRLGAAEATVVASRLLAWPPVGEDSVRALVDAVEGLSAQLLAAGWAPRRPGTAWYARRFAWQPSEAATADQPPAGDTLPASRRFERRDWPEGTKDAWRCEIRWAAGYANSRFQALVHRPGAWRGRVASSSATFKWLMMDDPDATAPAHRSELVRLIAALEAVGWHRIEAGPQWYAERFVWPHAEPPPAHVGLPPVAEHESEPGGQ